MFDLHESYTEIGKLIIAALIGGAIGFERETHGQAAGIRTNILVSVGACLMMMLSLHMEEIYRYLNVDSVVRLDPGRIASYAIASMGFLGAGAIIKGRGTVRGLTTAAGLWLVTGIGLAVGAGYLIPAISSTLLSLVILYGIRRMKVLFPRDVYTVIVMKFQGIDKLPEQIKKIFSEFPELTIQFINFQQSITPRTTTYRLRLVSKEHVNWGEIAKRLSKVQDLEEISWEESEVP